MSPEAISGLLFVLGLLLEGGRGTGCRSRSLNALVQKCNRASL